MEEVPSEELAQVLKDFDEHMRQAREENPHGGLSTTESAWQHFPWLVPEELFDDPLYLAVRDHLAYMATGGRGMRADRLERAQWLYDTLRARDAVVEFDPSDGGSLKLVNRLPTDETLVRANAHTRITKHGQILLRFPPEDPRDRMPSSEG